MQAIPRRWWVVVVFVCALGWSGPRIAVATEAEDDSRQVRNLILVLGDGMGPSQVEFLLAAKRHAEGGPERAWLARLAEHGVIGMVSSEGHETLVIDSAAGATQIATGTPARPRSLGVRANGRPVPTLIDWARRRGMATGLVTDTRLTDATMASFVSHRRQRSSENEIAVDVLDSGVDLLLGGGLRHWIPASADTRYYRKHSIPEHVSDDLSSARDDNWDLLGKSSKKGYRLVFDAVALDALGGEKRVLGLFAAADMRDGSSEAAGRSDHQPDLASMTRKALDLLGARANGFILVVESGQIDDAGHRNDAGALLHEMLRFDRALGVVHEWVKHRRDTLVVVTADHETGGFNFSNALHQGEPPDDDGSDFVSVPPDLLRRIGRQPTTVADLLRHFEKQILAATRVGDSMSKRALAVSLRAWVKDQTSFEILTSHAERVITGLAEESARRRSGQPDPGERCSADPAVLLARALAVQQSVVWSTCTHTGSPVPLIAHGPPEWTQTFHGWYGQVELGRKLMQVLTNKKEASPNE